jgi:membrane protein
MHVRAPRRPAPRTLSSAGVLDLVRRLASRAVEHALLDVAAGTAFWALLAVFPFLFFAVSMLTLVYGHEVVDAVVRLVIVLAPRAVQTEVRAYANAVLAGPSGREAVVALLVALWSASGGALSIGEALDRAYGVHGDARGYWRRRMQAISAVVLTAIFLGVAAALITFAPLVVDRVLAAASLDALAGPLWLLARWPVALVLAFAAWGLAYRYLPCRPLPLRFVTPGAIVGIPLWIVASSALSFYVTHVGRYGTAYGSLGGAVVFLLWLWISTLMLLLGGELNAMLEAGAPRGGRPGDRAAP